MLTPIDYQQLRNYLIFQDLPDEALVALSKHCRYIELQAGQTLFHQNDPSDSLYLLENGQIHVIRQYPDGEGVILATEGPYYVIGDLSMLVKHPRVAAVVAVSDCTLIALDRQAFAEVCEQVPSVAAGVVAYLAQRLHRLNLQVKEYAIGNIAARVASALWLLSDGEAGEVKSKIRVSRLARATATDGDTVERILEEWDEAGYITYAARQVIIHDIETIRDIAG